VKKGSLTKFIAIVVAALMLSIVFTACKDNVSGGSDFYILNYDPNDGGTGKVFFQQTTFSFDGRSVIVFPVEPIREDGFAFDGWYFDKDIWREKLTAEYFLERPLKASVTVFAKWTRVEGALLPSGGGEQLEAFAVTLVSNDTREAANFLSGGVLTLAEAQSYFGKREEYLLPTFVLADGSEAVFPIVNPMGGTITLYTSWTMRTYPLYFDVNGDGEFGQGDWGDEKIPLREIKKGEIATLPLNLYYPKIENERYQTNGWLLTEDDDKLYRNAEAMLPDDSEIYVKVKLVDALSGAERKTGDPYEVVLTDGAVRFHADLVKEIKIEFYGNYDGAAEISTSQLMPDESYVYTAGDVFAVPGRGTMQKPGTRFVKWLVTGGDFIGDYAATPFARDESFALKASNYVFVAVWENLYTLSVYRTYTQFSEAKIEADGFGVISGTEVEGKLVRTYTEIAKGDIVRLELVEVPSGSPETVRYSFDGYEIANGAGVSYANPADLATETTGGTTVVHDYFEYEFDAEADVVLYAVRSEQSTYSVVYDFGNNDFYDENPGSSYADKLLLKPINANDRDTIPALLSVSHDGVPYRYSDFGYFYFNSVTEQAAAGAAATPVDKFKDDLLIVLQASPQRKNYKFLGFTDKGAAYDSENDELYAPGRQLEMPGNNVTFTAVWERNTADLRFRYYIETSAGVYSEVAMAAFIDSGELVNTANEKLEYNTGEYSLVGTVSFAGYSGYSLLAFYSDREMTKDISKIPTKRIVTALGSSEGSIESFAATTVYVLMTRTTTNITFTVDSTKEIAYYGGFYPASGFTKTFSVYYDSVNSAAGGFITELNAALNTFPRPQGMTEIAVYKKYNGEAWEIIELPDPTANWRYKAGAQEYSVVFTEKGTDGIRYTLKADGTYAVTGFSYTADDYIIIPSYYQGKPVTYIDKRAFAEAANGKIIVIPNTVIKNVSDAVYTVSPYGINVEAFSGATGYYLYGKSDMSAFSGSYGAGCAGTLVYDETGEIEGWRYIYQDVGGVLTSLPTVKTNANTTASGVFTFDVGGNTVTGIGDKGLIVDNKVFIPAYSEAGKPVYSIGVSAFSVAATLLESGDITSIYIPWTVNDIAANAFNQNFGIMFEVDPNNKYYYAVEGALYKRDGDVLVYSPND
jgi:hypothetical protein